MCLTEMCLCTQLISFSAIKTLSRVPTVHFQITHQSNQSFENVHFANKPKYLKETHSRPIPIMGKLIIKDQSPTPPEKEA